MLETSLNGSGVSRQYLCLLSRNRNQAKQKIYHWPFAASNIIADGCGTEIHRLDVRRVASSVAGAKLLALNCFSATRCSNSMSATFVLETRSRRGHIANRVAQLSWPLACRKGSSACSCITCLTSISTTSVSFTAKTSTTIA